MFPNTLQQIYHIFPIMELDNPTLFSILSCHMPIKYVIKKKQLSMLTTIDIISEILSMKATCSLSLCT